MDTEDDQEFDNLAKLAAQICDVPIAKINFIDEQRTWSKANYGNFLKESPREYNFCHTTIQQDEFMVIEDASKDDRFNDFEFVIEDPKLRFYAGVNIKKNQQNLGTICVLGQEPKQLSDSQLSALKTLASEVEARMELNLKNKELETTAAFLEASVDLMLILDAETLMVEKVSRNGDKLFPKLNPKDLLKPLDELLPNWNYTQRLRECFASGITTFSTESKVHINGEDLYLQLHAIVKDKQWLITAKDITPKRVAEEEVLREQQFSNAIIQALPISFFMYNENGNLIKWNRNAVSPIGYTDEEYAELTPMDFFDGEDLARIQEYIRKTLASEKSLGSIQASLVRKDGVREPYLFNGVCFKKGGREYLIGTGQSIAAQRKYQQKLEALLAEKEVILAEVHHRVKNNLAVISGFLQMQEFLSEDEVAKSVLLSNHMRVKSMAFIHEELYKVEDFNGIRFDEYLAELLHFIQEKRSSADKNITLKTIIAPFEMNVNQALPLALIINELVSNAYEYAFIGKSTGEIEVELRIKGNEIHLFVRDDGVGLPEGFVLEKSPTLGTTLVSSYSEQINSEINITSSADEGTEYELIFHHKKTHKGSAANVFL